jgi:hypothetical protein
MKKWILPLALIAGWLIPGAAHSIYGKRYKALIFFALIAVCSIIGIIIADFRFIRYADNPFYYIGQFGSGLTWLIVALFTSHSPKGLIPMFYFEIGMLYICVSGILNLVFLLSLYAQQNNAVQPAGQTSPADEKPTGRQSNETITP